MLFFFFSFMRRCVGKAFCNTKCLAFCSESIVGDVNSIIPLNHWSTVVTCPISTGVSPRYASCLCLRQRILRTIPIPFYHCQLHHIPPLLRNMQAFKDMYIYIYMCVCVHVYMYVYMHICIYILYISININDTVGM